MISSDILMRAFEALRMFPLCTRCLGRLFAQLGKGLSNVERGRAISILLAMEIHRIGKEKGLSEEHVEVLRRLGDVGLRIAKDLGISLDIDRASCYICGGLIDKWIDSYSLKIAEELKKLGLRSFLVGIILPPDVEKREREVAKRLGIEWWESIRSELKREIGKRVRDLTGVNPDFEDPDATFIVDIASGDIRLEIPSILILGNYWKLGRRISQVPWIKKDGSRKYPLSIEDVLQYAAKLFNGERAVFHGAGREDVDVRMLGSGRPFVLEIVKPLKRSVPIDEIIKVLNSVSPWLKFSLDKRVRREVVSRIKSSTSRGYKVYRALVVTSRPVSEEELKAMEEFFRGRIINQRTPKRVLRRRKDILRRRRVIDVRTRLVEPTVFEALIKCEGGLYVKELVSGDEGRTTPSFAEFLNCEAECIELDVLYVHKYI